MLHSICQHIWKTQQWPQDWKRSVFIPIPKKGNAKECSNYHISVLISHVSKVMLKILQARLHQYVNSEFPDFQAGFTKGRETRDNCQHPVDHWKSKRLPEKHLLLLYWLSKPLTVWITTNWKILKEMGIPYQFTCLLRNLCTGQEATIRTEHGTSDGSKLGKEYVKAVYCHPAYLTSMQSTSWETLGWKDKLESDCQEKYQ